LQTRHKAISALVMRVASRSRLPDADFVVYVGDDGGTHLNGLPVFTISWFDDNVGSRPRNPQARQGIRVPDHSYFSWSDSLCPTEFSHDSSYMQDSMHAREGGVSIDSWKAKDNQVFWRGKTTESDRWSHFVRDANMSMYEYPQGMTPPSINASAMVWSGCRPVNCVTLFDHCRKRYLLHMEDSSNSNRLRYLFMCGSTVLMGYQPWHEWYYEELLPDVHYVSVDGEYADFESQMAKILKFGEDRMYSIAANGQRLVMDLASEESVDCFWSHLIHQANRLWGTTETGLLTPLDVVMMDWDRNWPIQDWPVVE